MNAQSGSLNDLAVSQIIRDSQTKAVDVLSSDAVRKAVDLSAVSKDDRERYGRNLFGQSVLLGRRLRDAGCRLVQCNWQRAQGINGFAGDTHWNNFTAHHPQQQRAGALAGVLPRAVRRRRHPARTGVWQSRTRSPAARPRTR